MEQENRIHGAGQGRWRDAADSRECHEVLFCCWPDSRSGQVVGEEPVLATVSLQVRRLLRCSRLLGRALHGAHAEPGTQQGQEGFPQRLSQGERGVSQPG